MFTHDILALFPYLKKSMPKLDITAAGSNRAEWKTFSPPVYPPTVNPGHYLASSILVLAAELQEGVCLAKSCICISKTLKLPEISAEIYEAPLPVLLQNTTHPFPPQCLCLPVCDYVCMCAWNLPSHRAIIQLQSQRQVAGSVVFDKLCWLPHFCCIWEPYTGILMDKGGTGSEPFNHCTDSNSLSQNYSKTSRICTSGKWRES